ncbi:MAG: hypothetical protein ABR576_11745 [Thermoanaerobaculia bacterium]
MSSDPVFTSATETREKLLERVRRRLRRTGAPESAAAAVPEPPLDLQSGEGLLEGWYAPEQVGGISVRWTQQRFTFRTKADDATHLLVEACLFPESGLEETFARLKTGDDLGAPVRVRQGWNRLLFALPAARPLPTSFALDAGASWCPADSGLSGDDRELGLAVRRIELVRLPALPRFADLVPPAVRAALPPPVPPRSGPLFRAAAKLRRMLLGWSLTETLERNAAEAQTLASELDGLRAFSAQQARLLDEAMATITETVRALRAEDERIRREAAAALRESREELARKIRHLADAPPPR